MPIMRRIMFIITAKLIFIGIWLSGWSNVHWFLYFTPVVLSTFAITGICPAALMKRRAQKPVSKQISS